MQTLTVYQNTQDGLRIAGPELGAEGAALMRLRAERELEMKTLLQTMQDNAVRHKNQGNLAMENWQHRHAVKEYNRALEHAHAMMEHLEMEKPLPMNGYQLRAIARGQPLPKRGPASLEPFRALLHANRSLAFLRLDAYEQAIEDAAEACRLEPRYLKAWVRRAAALAAANRRDEALAALEEALSTACPSEATKEQVCKLIVNLRLLGRVDVRPPEKDLPVVYKDSGKPGRKKKEREVVKVPLGMLRPAPEGSDGAGAGADTRMVFAEVDKRDLNSFLREHWHATHLGGRWRQTRDEVTIVVNLPRRPKLPELLVQIRPRQLWVLLRKPGATGEQGREDYDTVADARLAGAVKASESTWTLEGGGSKEIHFSLQKESAHIDPDAPEGVTAYLWGRAFEGDEPADLRHAAPADPGAGSPTDTLLRTMRAECARLRKRGNDAEADKIESYLDEIQNVAELPARDTGGCEETSVDEGGEARLVPAQLEKALVSECEGQAGDGAEDGQL